MKKVILSLSVAALLVACGGEAKKADVAPKADTTPTVEAVSYAVNAAESKVNWAGKKLAYGHNGTINIKEGNLLVEGGKVVGGTIAVDMTSIINLDLETPKKDTLEAHLMGANFFKAAKYPTATLKITGAANDSLVGDLTILEATHTIKFPVTQKVSETGVEATANIIIDRTEYGVVYGSGFAGAAVDQAIHDDINFEVIVKAAK